MAERDAFGNKKGEDDALADMGWSLSGGAPSVPGGMPTDAPPPPSPPPSPSAVPSAPPPPTATFSSTPPSAPPTPVFTMPDASQLPQIPGMRRRGVGAGLGRMVGLLISIGVIGAIVAAVIGGVNSVSDKVRSVTDSFTIPAFSTATGSTPTPESPSTPSKPPTGLAPGSMLRADRFGPALVKLRSKGSRAQTLRIDAERVSGNVLDASGNMTIVSVAWNGDGQVIDTPARLSTASAVSLKAVTSKAPSRAVARAAGLLGRPARQVNYVVLTDFAGTAKWFVYFKDGRYVSASLDGRKVQRIG